MLKNAEEKKGFVPQVYIFASTYFDRKADQFILGLKDYSEVDRPTERLFKNFCRISINPRSFIPSPFTNLFGADDRLLFCLIISPFVPSGYETEPACMFLKALYDSPGKRLSHAPAHTKTGLLQWLQVATWSSDGGKRVHCYAFGVRLAANSGRRRVVVKQK